jgi:SAM-dependent methyltransferase
MRGVPAGSAGGDQPGVYWEARARRFASVGEGLAAVCSYGMPEFYNRAIHLNQRIALAPWLKVLPGTRVLDVGCGVGRWSRILAGRGAQVTGIDISPTMVDQARRRAAAAGLQDRCRFLVADSSELHLPERFDFILGVTVLQHILDPGRLLDAVRSLAAHARPAGRIVLLEAAPVCDTQRCDSAVFKARHRDTYLQLFDDCGLRLSTLTGVDPAPFRWQLLPHLRGMPRFARVAAIAAATALSAPWDLLFGRASPGRSWHAVFVLQAPGASLPCA